MSSIHFFFGEFAADFHSLHSKAHQGANLDIIISYTGIYSRNRPRQISATIVGTFTCEDILYCELLRRFGLHKLD